LEGDCDITFANYVSKDFLKNSSVMDNNSNSNSILAKPCSSFDIINGYTTTTTSLSFISASSISVGGTD